MYYEYAALNQVIVRLRQPEASGDRLLEANHTLCSSFFDSLSSFRKQLGQKVGGLRNRC